MVRERKERLIPKPIQKGKLPAGESSKWSKGIAQYDIPHFNDLKEGTWFHYNQNGHWKRNYPKYPQEIKNANARVSGSSYGMYMVELYNTKTLNSMALGTRCGFYIFFDMQGPRL